MKKRNFSLLQKKWINCYKVEYISNSFSHSCKNYNFHIEEDCCKKCIVKLGIFSDKTIDDELITFISLMMIKN